MSRSPAPKHLFIQLHPSRWLALLLLLSHSLALYGIWFADVPLWLQIALSPWIAWHFWHSIRQHVLFQARQLPLRFSLYDGTLLLDDEHAANIEKLEYWHPWLLIVRLRFADQRMEYLLVLPDMLDKTTFRRFRVRLRYD